MIIAGAIAAITSMLADKGLNVVKNAIEGGADKAIDYVSKKTGIDLSSEDVKKNGLTNEQIVKLQELESSDKIELEKLALENKKEDNRHDEFNTSEVLKDKDSSRKMNVNLQSSKDWLVRNTGSIIAIFVVVSTFGLWFSMLIGATEELNQTVIVGINNSLTLSLGYVLAFYFGSSKTEADSKRI